METFAERLSRFMRSAGLTEANMSFLLGISGQRLENLLTGYSEADIDIVRRTAEIFNVPCAYAAGISNDPVVHENNAKEIFVSERLEPVSGMMMLRDVKETIYIDKNDVHGKDYIGLIAKDDSMVKARIYKDCRVIVRRQSFAANNSIVAVLTEDGEYIFRRYNRTGNMVVLTSEGDGLKYPCIKIDTSEAPLHIIGVVVECRISF